MKTDNELFPYVVLTEKAMDLFANEYRLTNKAKKAIGLHH